jgi:hypothetical protein
MVELVEPESTVVDEDGSAGALAGVCRTQLSGKVGLGRGKYWVGPYLILF